MANDPPTSLRMGFGYHEARASGVTKFGQPRAASSVNADVKERAAIRQIASLLNRPPSKP